MAQSSLRIVGDSDFESLIRTETRPVLLDFSATWCGPCKMVDPILASIADERRDALLVVKVDIDASPALAVRYGVRGAPTLVLLQDGEEVSRRLGAASKSTLLAWLPSSATAAAAP